MIALFLAVGLDVIWEVPYVLRGLGVPADPIWVRVPEMFAPVVFIVAYFTLWSSIKEGNQAHANSP